ncbi:hypothetical protein [Pseudoxanthomonas winnipegensis]|uniref:Uncharacterized protein n=1 Tax=Pseudoxanthomonas winnipegensis TaxID=2480810 RepID=A0A4Q8LCW3_9GAMM|nr:hypothetical protein [Pseudoxanthomonas winnipegensis]TAA26541.1 hypothetical protein EA660_04730 [Pseudoxanthomonas winnipegensis]
MTQREIKHHSVIPGCREGHPARLMLDARRCLNGGPGGHFVECRCRASARFADAGDALRDWSRVNGKRAPRTAAPADNIVQLDLLRKGGA